MFVDSIINATQGLSIPSRWQWNATVGNLIDRPGRMGNWGYINTESADVLLVFLPLTTNRLPFQWSRASRTLVPL